MSVRWRKLVGDARQNGVQIGLIALALALGTASVVAALDARAILEREIAASYAAAEAPDVALWFDDVTPRALAFVAAQEGVAAVEARRVAYLRVAASDGSWLPMRVTVVADIDSQRLAMIHRHDDSPTGVPSGLWIEQSGRTLVDVGPAQSLRVRTTTGDLATVPLAGYVHDTAVAPSTQERVIYAFATPAAAALVGIGPGFDQLLVRMQRRGDAGDAAMMAGALRDRLAASGQPPLRVDVLQNAHPHAALMNAMVRVLGVLSAIAVICGGALAGYLMSVWMRREVRQVGIMKATGARWHQIAVQYLLLVAPLLMVVAVIAVPAGIGLGRALAVHYADVLNIDIADWRVGAALKLREVASTLGIALVAMAWPIVRASRMPVHAALHDPGIASPLTAGSRLAKAITLPGGMRGTVALRNTLRRPLRLVLILFALAGGGALLLTTHSNYESLMSVIDRSLATQAHDIEVVMPRAFPAAQLEGIARKVPDVVVAEAWRRVAVSAAYAEPEAASTADTRRVSLVGYPPDSRLFKLPVLEGRLPASDALNEVLMTRTVQEPYPSIRVGSDVLVRFRDRQTSVRVVGLVEEIGNPTFYAAFPAFDNVTALGDASTVLRVKAGDHPESVASALDQALLGAHLAPAQMLTRAMFRDALDEHFKVVGDVLKMVALAAALLGAIILAAGTAFNVLERTREIGVMRALGATMRGIGAMLLAESAAVALVAALLSVAISIALTLALNDAAARTLLHVAVPLRFSLEGVAVLCGGALVVMLAVGLALALTMRRTVRETLNYEG